LDLEVYHAIQDDIPDDQHERTENEGGLGDWMILDPEIVIWGYQRDECKQDERGQRQHDRREASFTAQRPYLQAQLQAVAQHHRKPTEDFRKIAAGLMLDIHRG